MCWSILIGMLGIKSEFWPWPFLRESNLYIAWFQCCLFVQPATGQVDGQEFDREKSWSLRSMQKIVQSVTFLPTHSDKQAKLWIKKKLHIMVLISWCDICRSSYYPVSMQRAFSQLLACTLMGLRIKMQCEINIGQLVKTLGKNCVACLHYSARKWNLIQSRSLDWYYTLILGRKV